MIEAHSNTLNTSDSSNSARDVTPTRQRSRFGGLRRLLIVPIAAAGLFGAFAPTAAHAVMDPSGTGAGAHTTIACDPVAHKVWVYTQQDWGYTSMTSLTRNIWYAVPNGQWHQFTNPWEIPTSTWGVYGLSNLAGYKLMFYIGYRFGSSVTTQGYTTAYEWPSVLEWNSAQGQWLPSQYCTV